jgi:hypothetical protein
MPRQIHPKIQAAIDAKKYAFELSPFPISRNLNRPKGTEGKIIVQFGLKSQDKLDFIERAMSDGMGWEEIARCIGWIDYAVFESYYSYLYADLLDEMGLFFHDCQRPKMKNKIYLNPQSKKLEIITENEECEENTMFRTGIHNVQFFRRDKEKHDKSDKTFPELYMVGSNPPTNLIFHATMQDESGKFTIKNDNYYFLIEEIIKNIKKGNKLLSPVYFDNLDLAAKEKYCTEKNVLQELLNLDI